MSTRFDLVGMLIRKGYLDEQRVGVRPRMRHCKRCGRAVIAALADDGPQAPGIRVTLDVRELTPLGELQALTLGLLTFHITGGLVAWRDPSTIARRSAADSHVFARHRCTTPPIDHKPDPPTRHAAAADPDHPPF